MACAAHELARNRGFLLWEDVDLIGELVEALAERPILRVVDLGAGSGTTAGAVFAARQTAVEVYTYDISQDAINWARLFIQNIGFEKQWSGIVRDSVEAARMWANGSIDLLLLDTSHVYEPTVRELATWRTRIAPGGLIWCHDYTGPDGAGVSQAIDEAVARGEFETIKTLGYGWAGRPT